jgi:hypothetical protein
MIYHLTPVHKEAPLMFNPALGQRAYKAHHYIHAETELHFILVSYKDASDMINFAHYIEHPDGFIAAYIEGVCPAKEDYDIVIADINQKIAEMHPEDPAAKLYRSQFKFHLLN